MDVRILGPLEVTDTDAPVDLGLRQARALFGVLAVQPGSPVRSSRLAEVLWPGGPPPRWEATVQSHVSRLRRALEPDRPPRAPSKRLTTHGDSYALHLRDDELDARRFELLAAEGRAALARAEHERADDLLGRAVAEWRGPVLADLVNVADLTLITAERSRLEELRALATEDRAEAVLALGDHARAATDLEALIAAHPLRERCWELLLLALYRGGRQAEALRRYQEVRSLLVGELGVEPGPALRALEAAILRQEVDLGPLASAQQAVAAVDIPVPAWLHPPRDEFVGRGREIDFLLSTFQRVRQGQRRLALVEGEPGIGKTRLVREICRILADDGALVLGGRCLEEPLHVLQPFAEAIDRLGVAHGERLARDAPVEAAALASLVPDLSRHVVPVPAVDAEAHRYLLFRAVGGLLDANLPGRPIVLVLDDLQWAAHASLQLLSHVLRDDERGPLLVLATARDTEPNDDFADLVAELHRERRLTRVTLAGLGPADVTALAVSRGHTDTTTDFFTMTDGNPFYVEELVRHVTESGGMLDPESVPDSVRDTVARRLLRLPESVRRVLGIAAVAEGEFDLAVVSRATDLDIEAADDALTLASRAGIVAPQPGRAGSYAFSHALIQTVLREGLGAARRARVHRRLGESLAAVGGPETEIARHLLAAADDGSDLVPGAEAALAAAASAVARHSHDDAVAVLRSARRALARHPAADPVQECRVAIGLAAALRRSGHYDERVALLEEAWRRAKEMADVDLAADVVDEGCSGIIVPAEPWPSRAAEMCALLDEECDRRVVFTSVLSRVRSQEPGETARQLAEWALARVSRLRPGDRCTVIECGIAAVGASSPIERVVDLARAGLGAAREARDAMHVIEALSVLRRAYLSAGDLSASDDIAREYEDLVRAARVPRYVAGVEQRRAMRALLAGRFVDAEAHAHATVALQPTTEFMEAFAVQIFAIRFEQGRLDEVRSTVESWGGQDHPAAWPLGLSAQLAESGELGEAAGVLERLSVDGFAEVPRDELHFLSLGVAATVVAHTGDRAAGGVLYELLAPHASRVVVAAEGALCWGSIHRFLGPLSAVLADTERASMHFEAAMSVHERLGARPFLARDRLAYAELLHTTGGDPLRVDDLHRTGLALATQLGMHAVVERYESRD